MQDDNWLRGFSLLEKYGLKVRDDLVFDEQNARGPVPVQGQMFLVNYPSFVAIAGGDHALTVGNNVIHGSDGPESAQREISLFFSADELLSYPLATDSWLLGD